MSVSFSCHCDERKKPVEERDWIVLTRKGNYSYFEYPKGQFHRSDYSTVYCRTCRVMGRTKAKYVSELKDGSWDLVQ